MRILVLTSSNSAPTYNEKIISQVNYINTFSDMYAELHNNMPLHAIEEKIIKEKFECVFPAVVFDYSKGKQNFTFNKALYSMLLYHNQEYIGSDIYTQMLLNDKALTNYRSGMGLPSKIITRVLWENKRDVALSTLSNISLPVIVKPNTLSASMGITPESVIDTFQNIELIIDRQFSKFPMLTEVLVEQYLRNAREYTVSVTGNDSNVIISPTALISKSGIHEMYSFENKNLDIDKRSVSYDIVSDIKMASRLSDCSHLLAKRFATRDYCRFDYLVDNQQRIFLIDANTIPALGNNYMYFYNKKGILRIEQTLALLVAVFSKRAGHMLPFPFLSSLPKELLHKLGYTI